jgi:hypothetical protein
MTNCLAIYQAIDDGDNFIFVDINRSGQILSEVNRSEVIGKRVTEAFPAVEKIGLLEVFRRVWPSVKAQHSELSGQCKCR